MTRIRIRCRVPEQTSPFCGLVAGFRDVEVFAVAIDGTETPLTNVDRVEFRAEAGEEPARAVVTFLQPEIDVEAVDEIDSARVEKLAVAMWGVATTTIINGERSASGAPIDANDDYPDRMWRSAPEEKRAEFRDKPRALIQEIAR